MTDDEILLLDGFSQEAEWMLRQLDIEYLEVRLSASIDETGRKCRQVVNRNPDWYRSLFNEYHNGRNGKKANGTIKRINLIKALKRIIKKDLHKSRLFFILFDIIKDRLFNGYEHEGQFIPPTIQEH